MHKKLSFLLLTLCLNLPLSACQSGSSNNQGNPVPTPTPTPTPIPESGNLATYIHLLTYTPNNTSKELKDSLPQFQQTMNLNTELEINDISINFYSDSQCSSELTKVSMTGSGTLLAGSYTTTTDSNLAVCSLFQIYGNSGCVYEYSYTQSLNFVITSTTGNKVNGACMTNPAWSGEKIGYYNLTQNWARNCSIMSNCGFSQNYVMYLN